MPRFLDYTIIFSFFAEKPVIPYILFLISPAYTRYKLRP